MGWHAQTEWSLRFENKSDIDDLIAEMNTLMTSVDPEGVGTRTSTSVFISDWAPGPITRDDWAERLISTFHEDGELDLVEQDGVIIVGGYGSGKSWDIGLDPHWARGARAREPLSAFRWNAGGEGVYAMLSRHCAGSIDWHDEEDHFWRDRLYGDGRFRRFYGKVVFPGDDGED